MPFDDNLSQADTGWTVNRAADLYHLHNWNGGYFQINASGELCACHRDQDVKSGVSLLEIISKLQSEGLELPVLVRFSHILQDRLQRMYSSFDNAADSYAFKGNYRAVYPVKVNQQYSVVETLKIHGGHRFGFEAGSKAELMAVLALADEQSSLVICNGYKDRGYIRLALIGILLGLEVYIIIEKYTELKRVLAEAENLNVTPRLGLRVRLSSMARGKWQNSGGEMSKFGLSASEVLRSTDLLREHDKLESVQLLHFHIGSQVADIEDVKAGLQEAARYFHQLLECGMPIKTLDVGGGLGVDYEGTASTSYCSVNYSVEDYMKTLVGVVCKFCDDNELSHPNLITEAGRAMTAHHSVLLTNVIDIEHTPEFVIKDEPVNKQASVISRLRKIRQDKIVSDASARLAEANACLEELQQLFVSGGLDLAQYALGEKLYYQTCRLLLQHPQISTDEATSCLLKNKLAGKYFCNFSIFQSLPDIWAFDQVFPVMPVHRLDQPPENCARLQDLTCDSDGQISCYVTERGVESALPVHAVDSGELYVLGIFLTGAYQEILGDMHNLFGDTHSVDVALATNGEYTISEPEYGDTVDDLLRYVHFDTEKLKQYYQAMIQQADLEPLMKSLCEREIISGFSAYSYHVSS